ncbi:hypothetical protein QAD02_011975 [Eretmocerus hayati]|uniref:Uncharacterized protein n=1 Tax=Eretmocerus hayati TaxID=131215 RepID=A0ACC2P0Z0_9HYME|nr:hypothetical protein QAD02_011975 [Eretmocerus hayati]
MGIPFPDSSQNCPPDLCNSYSLQISNAFIHFVNHHEALSKTDISHERGKPTPFQCIKDTFSKENYGVTLFGNESYTSAKNQKYLPYQKPETSELHGRSHVSSIYGSAAELNANQPCNQGPEVHSIRPAQLKIRKKGCEVIVNNILIYAGEFLIYGQDSGLDTEPAEFHHEEIVVTRKDIITSSCDTVSQSDSDLLFETRRLRISANKGESIGASGAQSREYHRYKQEKAPSLLVLAGQVRLAAAWFYRITTRLEQVCASWLPRPSGTGLVGLPLRSAGPRREPLCTGALRDGVCHLRVIRESRALGAPALGFNHFWCCFTAPEAYRIVSSQVKRKLILQPLGIEKSMSQNPKIRTSLHDGYVLKDVGVIMDLKQPWLCASLGNIVMNEEERLVMKCVRLKYLVNCRNQRNVHWVNQENNVSHSFFVNSID